MDITDMDSFQTGVFGNLLAAQGMGAGGGGKILQVKMRIEGQETVRNFRVKFSYIACNSCDFHLVHIARHQEGAGNEERWLRPSLDELAQDFEILEGFSIGHPAETIVNAFIPCLEIKFY